MRGKWKEAIDSLDIHDFLKPFKGEELLRHPAYEFNQEANLKLELDLSALLKTSPYYSKIEILPYDPLIDGDDVDNIRFEEVFFSDDEDAMASQEICQPGNIKSYVRGSLNSVPFQPGGEDWGKPETSKARTKLLEEAASLKWLEEWESGNLPDLLDEVSDFYDGEIEYDLNRLTESIEPILIMFIAVLVLILALGVFLPIWDLGGI